MENVEDILLDKPDSGVQTQPPDPSAEANGPDYECHPTFGSYRGRARRQEYWKIMLGLIFLVLIFAILCATMSKGDITSIGSPIVLIALLVGVLFTLPVSVRRLHDRDMSGWWLLLFWLLGLIPFVGFFSGIVQFVIMGCLDGTPGPNRYGPDPKGRNFTQPGNASMPVGLVNATPEERIRKLKAMMDDGIISKTEYEEKRAKLLAQI